MVFKKIVRALKSFFFFFEKVAFKAGKVFGKPVITH